MGYEISYSGSRPPRDAQILAQLRAEYPDKDFTIHNGTIVESYRTQPSYQEMLTNSRWHRPAEAAGARAVALTKGETADEYIGRVMSNEV